jgi:Anti-sigma-K factor rskA
MSNPPLNVWRRGSRARRQAAEQALSEDLLASSAGPDTNELADQTSELASMRSLIQTLERLPEQAWNHQIHTAATSSPAESVARRQLRSVRLQINSVRAGALVAVALAFVIGALIDPFSATPHPENAVSRATAHVILQPLAGAPSTSRAIAYMPGGNQMLVRIRNLPRSAPGTYYELWLMTSNTDLVSVTSFRIRATGTDSLQLLLPDSPSHYKYLDISVQHVGDEGAISQDNVLRGAIHA